MPLLAFAGICRGMRPGTHGTWADRRCRAPWRSGPGLAIGLEQTRLANPFPGPCFLPITGHPPGGGGTAPPPHPDEMSGYPTGRAPRPHQFERRKQPPALVAPQNAARDQLPGHRRGVQALAAEAARDPQTATQLADLWHAVHGLADGTAPDL